MYKTVTKRFNSSTDAAATQKQHIDATTNHKSSSVLSEESSSDGDLISWDRLSEHVGVMLNTEDIKY